MYDDLVKRLRGAAKMSEALAVLLPNSEGSATAKLYNEAADAIEELAASVEGFEAQTNMVLDRDGNNTVIRFEPRWIPVTERLPKCGTKCLVTRYDHVTEMPFVDLLWFDNSWWDRLNSGDYAVTHWMPLPQPPEEV